MNKPILAIDGTNREVVHLGIFRGSMFNLASFPRKKIDATLPLVLRFCAHHRLQSRDLAGLAVVPGPGHFSSVREATVLANVLAWETGVPLFVVKPPLSPNSVRARERVERIVPKYGARPHITKPKRLNMRV